MALRFVRKQGWSRPAAASVAALLAAGCLLWGSFHADALRVTMKRVVFEGPVRTEVLTIINNTAAEQVYRLGWKQLRMTEDKSLMAVREGGKIEPVPGFKEVTDMIRFAPRRVVLPPGSSQQVRLMLRRPKDLKDGEYRAHFWIQPEAESVKFQPEKKELGPKDSAVHVKMLTGITLPVIVRQGDLKAAGSIADAAVAGDTGQKILKYTLLREGGRSLYGDMEITCASAKGEIVLQQIRGIAVYTEVGKRLMAHKLKDFPEGGCSALHMKYRADEEDPLFKGGVIAESDIRL